MIKTKVVLGQLGSPRTDSIKDVRAYLREFLSDPRVVDLPPFIWKLILYLFVLPFRPKKSAAAYSRIYDGKSFPLISITESFAAKIERHLDENIELNTAFLLSSPRIDNLLDQWEGEDFDLRAQELVVLPQFPQYSEATVASVFDVLGKAFGPRVNIPHLRFITSYHRLKAFIDLSAQKITERLADDVDALIISFHGVPTRRIYDKKDEYYLHCWETFHLIKMQLSPELQDKTHLCFQSRFGSEKWLTPATDEYAVNLAKQGAKKIGFYCPSFVVDCLETTDEIGNELAEDLKEHHCTTQLVPCLNDDEDWAEAYAQYINTLVNGSKAQLQDLFYKTDRKELRETLPDQNYTPAMDPKKAKSLRIIFLTLFLDLVGFSIIFPLFPAMAKYYLLVDNENFFLTTLFDLLGRFTLAGGTSINTIVLFGGILGALYSLLQFLCAPIWGRLSDKYGRAPILKLSVGGIFLSYVLWFFSGSFTLLLLARILGGIMGGNISVATAVASDVTTEKNRSKGMAIVGIAFALGFLVGPALGGLAFAWDLSQYEFLANLGVNPFSTAALIAAVLSAINLVMLWRNFEETNTERKSTSTRSSNPLRLFGYSADAQVRKINLIYFLFIFVFSGMEFTLTFLALERLSYTPKENALMFIFVGVVLAVVQGGFVRRRAAQIGEAKVALLGLFLIIPGLAVMALTENSLTLYLGLGLLGTGSAMVIPTLTSMVSLMSSPQEQGEALGIFRSLGALGRVFGPIFSCLVFWKFGSRLTYFLGAAMTLLPLLGLGLMNKKKKQLP